VIHRRVKAVETSTSVAEDLDLGRRRGLSVSRGMVCEDVDDLLVAFRLLGLAEATICPLAASVDGSANVTSTDELRQYDFPQGPVALTEPMDLDRGALGAFVTVSYYFHGDEGFVGSTQNVTVGSSFFGCRTPSVPDTFDDKARAAAEDLAAALKPRGIFCAVFGMVHGEPVLRSAHLDGGNLGFFASKFMNRFFGQVSDRAPPGGPLPVRPEGAGERPARAGCARPAHLPAPPPASRRRAAGASSSRGRPPLPAWTCGPSGRGCASRTPPCPRSTTGAGCSPSSS